MKIITRPLFDEELKKILIYIATDSKVRARDFKSALRQGMNDLDNFPYKFRKSIHFDNDNIRDYIFKGYTMPYLIDRKNDIIAILDIFKWIDK